MKRKGYTVAVLEYPNYGVSMGLASLNSWLNATAGAVQFLNNLTGQKIFIVGHSIGGPLAIQAAAMDELNGLVAGVVTYGGFSDLYKMAKDNQTNKFIKLLSKFIAKLTLKQNIIDGVGNLETLMNRSIPTLIMHGQNDGAVLPTHLQKYHDKKLELQYINPVNANYINTLLFPDLFHEEINNLSKTNPKDFEKVWSVIDSFISHANTAPFSPEKQ